MAPSIDSSRPIMAPSVTDSSRASKRQSTVSAAPSGASTATTAVESTNGSDPRVQDLAVLQRGLARLDRPRLQQQRYEPSQEKSESIAKLALGAKVERALGRRMTGQDAVLRAKVRPLAVAAGGEKSG